MSALDTIPNFDVVDLDNRIYRGGQPTTNEQWQALSNAGVKQVIKLNEDSEGSDDGALMVGRMDVFRIGISTTEQIVTQPDPQYLIDAVGFIKPGTFVHCSHGQDRTGLVIGLYRLKQGWSKYKAQSEMEAHGIHWDLFGLAKAWADAN